MVDSEQVAALGALIGERARAEMLVALMTGEAQTATELALAAGVTKQTASTHLAKLVEGGLLSVAVQGRHHYFRIGDARVARLVESMIGVAARSPHARRFGPRDDAMRKARVCYDHLAGELGVLVHDSLLARGMLGVGANGTTLNAAGVALFDKLGVSAESNGSRRPSYRACLDWSVRRHHLAGALGAALLSRCLELGWARRSRESRALLFTADGERALRRAFPVA